MVELSDLYIHLFVDGCEFGFLLVIEFEARRYIPIYSVSFLQTILRAALCRWRTAIDVAVMASMRIKSILFMIVRVLFRNF